MAASERGDTRARLLDAALELVAEQGLQALTHRGVEERAGVSHGSTTYHFKTRDALLDAIQEHICARQLAWITAMYADLAAEAAAGGGVGVDERERFTRRAIEMMMSERTLTLARYELYLHGARHPHLQDVTRRLREQHVAIQAAMFAQLGAPDPVMSAHRLLSAFEGLLLYQLSVPETDFEAWATPYVMAVTDLLAGFDPAGQGRETSGNER